MALTGGERELARGGKLAGERLVEPEPQPRILARDPAQRGQRQGEGNSVGARWAVSLARGFGRRHLGAAHARVRGIQDAHDILVAQLVKVGVVDADAIDRITVG